MTKRDEEASSIAGQMLHSIVTGMGDQLREYHDAFTIIDYLCRDRSTTADARLERISQLVSDVRRKHYQRSERPEWMR